MADKPMVRQRDAARTIAEFGDYIKAGKVRTAAHLLPAMLNLNGKPFDLRDHFPTEAFFNLHMPRNVVLLAGRQVGKARRWLHTVWC